MVLAVLASPGDASEILPILGILKDLGIGAFGLKIGAGWENLTRAEIEARVGRATHFLLLASPESIGLSWFSFAIGVGFGRRSGTALFRIQPNWSPPAYLARLPLFDSREELEAFYRVERAEWEEGAARRSARAALLELGISYHAESFCQCAREGDVKSVELFLRSGMSPDTRDKHGVTVLGAATRGKHRAVAEAILDAGAQIDFASEDRGCSPLMDAALVGSVDLVRLYLGRGAGTDLRSKDGQTALVIAVGRGDVETVRALLEAGADPELPDKLGLTAGKYAALFKYTSIIQLLGSVTNPVAELNRAGEA